jgi:hypothetical protein
MRKSACGVAVAAVLVLAGCGGGGGVTLTKQEYVKALNRICLVGSDQFRELHLENTVADWKARGDHIVSITENATKKFQALSPPDELKGAAKEYNDAEDRFTAEIKNAVNAAKEGDATRFHEALSKSDAANTDSNVAARKIGAADC